MTRSGTMIHVVPGPQHSQTSVVHGAQMLISVETNNEDIMIKTNTRLLKSILIITFDVPQGCNRMEVESKK